MRAHARYLFCDIIFISLSYSSSSPQVNLEVVPLLCACDHPNLVRVCGFIRHGPTQHAFLVSQFVEGKSLAARLVSAEEGGEGRCVCACMCMGYCVVFRVCLSSPGPSLSPLLSLPGPSLSPPLSPWPLPLPAAPSPRPSLSLPSLSPPLLFAAPPLPLAPTSQD